MCELVKGRVLEYRADLIEISNYPIPLEVSLSESCCLYQPSTNAHHGSNHAGGNCRIHNTLFLLLCSCFVASLTVCTYLLIGFLLFLICCSDLEQLRRSIIDSANAEAAAIRAAALEAAAEIRATANTHSNTSVPAGKLARHCYGP